MLVSSIVSPHQMPWARYMADMVSKDNFRYVAMQAPLKSREAMGWDCSSKEPWVLSAGQKDKDRIEALKWWKEAEVVLTNQRLMGLISDRVAAGKLTFYMSERWWKPKMGIARIFYPPFALMAWKFRRLARSQSFHHMAIGYYAAMDMKRLAAFKDRLWLWGYFPELAFTLPQVLPRTSELVVLYAGRLLGWKRLDTLIRGFKRLNEADKAVRLMVIGDGPKRIEMKALAEKLGLIGKIDFLASISMMTVWRRMEKAHVFVLPSNGREGWGAVLNEAMTHGCAVVASNATGSAKTMIRHNENGLLFPQGDWRSLGELLCRLSVDEPLRISLAKAGQETIRNLWSPKVAAKRLLEVSRALISNLSPPFFHDGPMTLIR